MQTVVITVDKKLRRFLRIFFGWVRFFLRFVFVVWPVQAQFLAQALDNSVIIYGLIRLMCAQLYIGLHQRTAHDAQCSPTAKAALHSLMIAVERDAPVPMKCE